MRINFVTESGRWILGRWCDEWAKHIDGATVSREAIPQAVNIYVNYALMKGKTECDVAYFTHREFTDKYLQEKFDQVSRDCDWCIAQCENTAKLLPVDKTTIIRPGVGSQFIKDKLIIGIGSKPQEFNRKRMGWAQLLDNMPYIEIRVAGGDVPYNKMHKWYKELDYILVTSENEGGPMSVLEAVAMGKPLIVPRGVGWCDDYPAIRFSDLRELQDILNRLTYDRNAWRRGASQIETVAFKALTGSA